MTVKTQVLGALVDFLVKVVKGVCGVFVLIKAGEVLQSGKSTEQTFTKEP